MHWGKFYVCGQGVLFMRIKNLSMLVFFIMIIFISSCSQSEQPNDEQIMAAYKSANEAMWWFHITTMPLGNDNADPNMPAEPITFDERGAARVSASHSPRRQP
jgi:hypothetical protein